MKESLRVTIDGDLEKMMAAEILAAELAVTRAVHRGGDGIKEEWRRQIKGSGLGDRLSRTIRAKHYPVAKQSIKAASVVYSRAAKIVDAFDRGTPIRSKDGFWLAIPTPEAGIGGRKRRVSPGEWERRTGIRLRFVYRRGQPSLLVADGARISKSGRAVKSRSKTGRGHVSAIIFILVPQVTLRKRLDLARAVRDWEARLPGMIVQLWPESVDVVTKYPQAFRAASESMGR